MSNWVRFEEVRGSYHDNFGTISKDGRLIISNALAQKSGLVPGSFAELFYCGTALGIKPMDEATFYSVKVSSTAKEDHDFTKPTEKGSLPSAVVSVRTLLSARRITLTKRMRGRLVWDPIDKMLVFEFPTMEVTAAASVQHIMSQPSEIIDKAVQVPEL